LKTIGLIAAARSPLWVLLTLAVLPGLGYGEKAPVKPIADMENPPTYTIEGDSAKPRASINRLTASQGQASLRFEYEGQGNDRAAIIFRVDGAAGFNAIAFDIYCERENGTSLTVSLRQQVAEKDKAARYKAVLGMSRFMDGWTSVRLVKDAELVYKQDGGVEPDWGRIRTVSFSLLGNMTGKAVFYLDNIRFENVSGGKTLPNVLYNSSFEIAANPDVPDGWTRDLNEPPYGAQVWGIAVMTR